MTNTNTDNNTKDPAIISAITANIFLPGIGSWKLGYKKRGAAILIVMILSILMAGWSYASSINNQIDAALDISDDEALESSLNSSGSFYWVALGAIAFAYSFLDIFLIYRQKKK
jgi:hypothetical protein